VLLLRSRDVPSRAEHQADIHSLKMTASGADVRYALDVSACGIGLRAM
jgi:hypothetical protein